MRPLFEDQLAVQRMQTDAKTSRMNISAPLSQDMSRPCVECHTRFCVTYRYIYIGGTSPKPYIFVNIVVISSAAHAASVSQAKKGGTCVILRLALPQVTMNDT